MTRIVGKFTDEDWPPRLMNQTQPKYNTRVEILVEKGQEELLTDKIYQLSGKGFWLEDQGDLVLLKCYPDEPDAFLKGLSTSGLKISNINVEKEEPRDYAELTRQYFRPIRIGNLTIRAPWNKKKDNGREIIIEPGMAFGTGRHESTRIMIKLMDDVDFKGKTVLDIGCGSGILALYAHLLGAGMIYAVDKDLDAVLNAKKNADLNRSDNIGLICIDVRDIRGVFDVVLANIDIKTFSEYSEKVASLVKRDGFLFISGILRKNKSQLLCLFQGWSVVQFTEKSNFFLCI
jgi:ribosomal protein L11 methyltransferase